MARPRTRLLAALLALPGCGDDGTSTAASTSTGEPASATSVDLPTSGDTTTAASTSDTTSGGTMAISGTTSGTSTSSTSTTSGDDTTSTSSTSSDETTSSTSTGEESTSSASTGESSSEDASTGGPPINLFKNPSLETWTMAEVPNTTPDEWTNCSNDGLAIDAVPDSCMADPVVGTDGARYGRHYSGEGFAQTIPTIPGHVYALSFDYTAVDLCFGGPPSAAFEVLVDDVVLLSTPGGMIPMWNSADMQFMATADTADICFRKTKDGGQGGLDNLAAYDQG